MHSNERTSPFSMRLRLVLEMPIIFAAWRILWLFRNLLPLTAQAKNHPSKGAGGRGDIACPSTGSIPSTAHSLK